MKDYLGNPVHEGDTVVVAIRVGRSATLSRGKVLKEEVKPQYEGGLPTNMLMVEWSNIHKYWFPARHVVKIPEMLIPEARREVLNNVEEGISVS